MQNQFSLKIEDYRSKEVLSNAPAAADCLAMLGGIEQPAQHAILTGPDFVTAKGKVIRNSKLALKVYGKTNSDKSNVILVLHGLNDSQFAAGYNPKWGGNDGWWDSLIGPGKVLDTNRFCIVSPNYLGSCYGSSAPINDPEFPAITIQDIVEHLNLFMTECLKVKKFKAIVGGSMGGLVGLQYLTQIANVTDHLVMMAAAHRCSPQVEDLFRTDGNIIKADLMLGGNGEYGAYLARMKYVQEQMSEYYKKGVIKDINFDDLQRRRAHKRAGSSAPNSLIALMEAVLAFNLDKGEQLENIPALNKNTEVTLIAIRQDEMFPPAEITGTRNRLIHLGISAKLHVIEDVAGHGGYAGDLAKRNSPILGILAPIFEAKLDSPTLVGQILPV